MTELQNAIEGAQFYVDGEHLEIKGGNAKSKIDQSLEYLVAHVYSKLDLITENAGSDADIIAILTGTITMLSGMEPNRDAASAMEEYLEKRAQAKRQQQELLDEKIAKAERERSRLAKVWSSKQQMARVSSAYESNIMTETAAGGEVK